MDIFLLFIFYSFLNKLKGMSVLQMKSFPEVRFEFFQPCFIYGNDKAIFLLFLSSSSFFCTSIATSNSSLIRRRLLPPPLPRTAGCSARELCRGLWSKSVLVVNVDCTWHLLCFIFTYMLRFFFFSCHPLWFFSWGECVRGGEGEHFPPEGQEERTELSLPIRAPSI